MKKNTLLSVFSTFVTISFIFVFTNGSTVYGNTFSMPDGSNSGSDYHSYNIDKEENSMNEYNINNNHTTTSNNNTANTIPKNYDNSGDNSDNNDSNNSNSYNNSNNNTANNANKIENKTPAPAVSKTKKIKKNRTKKIVQIEFTKHFIKLPVGKTTSISFTTIPDKALAPKLIYKSLDNSVVTFNNKKVTGIKKGFSTIIIMLPNGTVKAACPVKIMWI